VVGNGTSAFTGVATIPYSEITGGPAGFSGDAGDIISGVLDDARMGVDISFGGGTATLPGGLIIKWGTVFIGQDSTTTITYGTPFPSATLSLSIQAVTTVVGSGSPQGSTGVSAVSASSFNASNDGDSRSHYWIAIGF
jgi:hypothetical protein